MEENKFERIVFMLLKIFGVISIIGGFLSQMSYYNYDIPLWGGHLILISPVALVSMIVSIVVYIVILRIIQRFVSISLKK